jgi:hypothetical protein
LFVDSTDNFVVLLQASEENVDGIVIAATTLDACVVLVEQIVSVQVPILIVEMSAEQPDVQVR